MNWDMLGAIAELVGALGVIISLVYLARQIRTSNRLARAEAWRSRFSDLTSLNASFGVDPRFHHAMTKVHQGALAEDLGHDEVALVSSYVISVANAVEQMFQEMREGIIDEQALDDFFGQTIFELPFYRSNWSFHRRILSPTFAAYLEKKHGLDASSTDEFQEDAP